MFYGKAIDWTNVKEELGDLYWYIAMLLHIMAEMEKTTPGAIEDQVREANIRKLSARYSEGKFNSTEAINRNLQAERQVLEESTQQPKAE
jgi:hypothetical protein